MDNKRSPGQFANGYDTIGALLGYLRDEGDRALTWFDYLHKLEVQ